MNVLMLLTPKSEVRYLSDNTSVKTALEAMRGWGYTALPVVTKDGAYAGTVSEGDFLRRLTASPTRTEFERGRVRDLIRPEYIPPVTVNVTMEELIRRAENQNFIPVTDDRGTFIGIVTRKTMIEAFCRPAAREELRLRA